MPAVQSVYNDRQRAGLPGLVVNMETQNSITRIVQEINGVGFGLPMVQGTTDKGVLLPDSYVYGAVAAAVGGNTGNGGISAVVVGNGVKEGLYKITFEDPAANAGSFFVEDPDGVIVDMGTVGVAFAKGGLTFTISDGATDFVEGDQFNITVTASAGGGAFRGYTIRDVTLQRREGETVDMYRKGDNVALLPAGVIWAVAGGACVAGQQVHFDPATNKHVAAGGYAPPNCSYETSAAADGELVQIRISHL